MQADGTHGATTPAGVWPWLVELGRVAPGLVEAHLAGSGGVDARTRERLVLAVSEANRCTLLSWIHEAWSEFLGPGDAAGECEPLVTYARTCAEIGIPLDATTLEATFAAPVVRSTRATVARAELGCIAGNAVEGLVPGGERRRSPRALSGLVVAAAALTIVVPLGALAGAMKVATRLAPPIPEPILPSDDEANLVVHLLADALPTYLGHTVVRAVLLWSPVVLALGVRAEGADATLRIGQGRVEICNGIRADAALVVDGGLEPLLHLAAGSVLRQLGVGSTADQPG